MRVLSSLFLLLFVVILGIFAWQNRDEVNLTFLNWSITASLALVMAGAFLAGMFSGWSIVGMLRRSARRTAELFERSKARTDA